MAKNKGGRPSEYKQIYSSEIITFMSKGYSIRSFAASIGYHHDTIYEWAKKHKEFADAIKKAKEKQAYWWENLGMGAVTGQVKNFNATAYVWMTKNMLGWRDRVDVHTEIEPIVIKINGKEEKYSIE